MIADDPTPPAAPVVPPRPWRRRLKRLGLGGLVLYVLLVAALYFAQEALIFPGSFSRGRSYARVTPEPGCELVRLAAPGGERVVALFGPALNGDGSLRADAASRPSILYFYGNGECLGVSREKFLALRRRGLNVLIPDYLGYGLSGGRAGEAGCLAAAHAAYDHLAARSDVDPTRIILGGFSLGGAVAIDVASRRPSIGLVVSCSFTSMGAMASRRYPFVPVALLLRHRFPSAEKIARVSCPILLARGRLDGLIPAAMTDSLAEAAGGPVTKIVMDRAGHDDLVRVADEGDAAADEALGRFLASLR